MSDNEESLKVDLDQDNFINEETNDFAKSLEEISKDDRPSTINKISQTSKTNNTISNLKNEMKENIFPYLNKDKIPEIKIKDENYFESGDKIENYLKTPINKNFNDNIYNICERCNKNNNCFYCLSCNINFCDICSENCKNNWDELIVLQKLKDEIEYCKKEIKRIIKENFIEPEKKETNGEKEQKSYKVFDEDKIIVDKSTEKIKAYSNDILLIRNILEKNYDNYFHFKNVINCLLYLQKKYCKNNLIESENNEFIRIDKNLNYLEYKYNSFYKNINEINMLIKIEKEDINKEIYFLDNGYKKI